MRLFLQSDRLQMPGHSAEHGRESTVTARRARGDAGVDQDNRDVAASGRPDKVRPHFTFGQHDGARPDGVERAAHEGRKVHGSVDGDPPVGLPFEGESVGGGRGAGNGEAPGGVAPVEFVEEFEGDEQFADADRMDPDPFTVVKA